MDLGQKKQPFGIVFKSEITPSCVGSGASKGCPPFWSKEEAVLGPMAMAILSKGPGQKCTAVWLVKMMWEIFGQSFKAGSILPKYLVWMTG